MNAWSQTVRILALSSVEFELAAVVRAATGVGLQPILSDFGLCCTDSGQGEVRHFAIGDLWVQHHSVKSRASKMLGLENSSVPQTKYLEPELFWRHTKACNWVLVGG